MKCMKYSTGLVHGCSRSRLDTNKCLYFKILKCGSKYVKLRWDRFAGTIINYHQLKDHIPGMAQLGHTINLTKIAPRPTVWPVWHGDKDWGFYQTIGAQVRWGIHWRIMKAARYQSRNKSIQVRSSLSETIFLNYRSIVTNTAHGKEIYEKLRFAKVQLFEKP